MYVLLLLFSWLILSWSSLPTHDCEFHILWHLHQSFTEPWGPRVAPRIYTSASWRFSSRGHFQHFWCVKAAVIDIDTGPAPAGAAAAVSHSFTHLSSPTPTGVAHRWSLGKSQIGRAAESTVLPFIFSDATCGSAPAAKRRPNFLITAVWLQQKGVCGRGRNLCLSDLRATWHSKVHDSVSESELKLTSVATQARNITAGAS